MNRAILLVCFSTVLLLLSYFVFAMRETTSDGFEVEKVEQADYLVYVIDGYSGYNKGQLMLYDPAEGVHAPILPDWDVERIALSAADRLVFTAVQEEERGIYILDYPFMDGLPVRIAGPLSARYFQLVWSQDGRYLAYVGGDDEGATLSMWDGTTIRHIYRSPEYIRGISWGPDGRLAFTVYHRFTSLNEGNGSEVYIWDSGITTSLSQNPLGEDGGPAWSGDGRLAFHSEQGGRHDIFVWDGVSKKNGAPDVDTFIRVTPHLITTGSYPVWTHDDRLAFGSGGEIYQWDGWGATNISQNPECYNGGQSWRSDGYWAFSTAYFSCETVIYVRDGKNRTRLTVEGHSLAWSPNGQLMFCTQVHRGWALSVWDGRSIIEVGQDYEIQASWPNGEGVVCWSG